MSGSGSGAAAAARDSRGLRAWILASVAVAAAVLLLVVVRVAGGLRRAPSHGRRWLASRRTTGVRTTC